MSVHFRRTMEVTRWSMMIVVKEELAFTSLVAALVFVVITVLVIFEETIAKVVTASVTAQTCLP